MMIIIMIEYFYFLPKLLKKFAVARVEDYADFPDEDN